MKIYLIIYEDGEYSDWRTYIESLHWTIEDAIDYLERIPIELYRNSYNSSWRILDEYAWVIPKNSTYCFAHRHATPQKYQQETYENCDGRVWMLDEKYHIDAIWYIVEKELHGHPRNVIYKCNRNAPCNTSDTCVKNRLADNFGHTPICDATTDVNYAARFEHIVDDLYAEKGIIYDHDNL